MMIFRNLVDHFPTRATEWITAAGLTSWGSSLLSNHGAFAGNPSFAIMAYMGDEQTWGSAALFVGVVHLIALFVNGSFEGFRYSPHLRTMTSGLACFVWCTVWVGLLHSTTGKVAYAMILAIEINNCWRAAGDIGEAERAREYGTRT